MNWKFLGCLVTLSLCGFSHEVSAQYCNDTLDNHVYNAYRLKEINSDSICMSVSGYINSMAQEADGDVHVRLDVDKQYKGMLNSANINDEYGTLVCEPVCYYAVSQSDAKSSCLDFTNKVKLPNVGQHVIITGKYVYDSDHGWNELHPVTSIEPYVATGVGPVYQTELSKVSVFPNPASDYVKFIFNDLPSTNKEVIIYNSVGQIVASGKPIGEDIYTMNTENLRNGIYIYAVVNTLNGEVYKGKLIVFKSAGTDD